VILPPLVFPGLTVKYHMTIRNTLAYFKKHIK
jgi:hypothetical protein